MLASFSHYQVSYEHNVKSKHDLIRLRQRNLEISSNTEIRSPHIGNVTCLASDGIDDRYLLAGGSDGRLSLFDLDKTTAPVTASDKIRCSRLIACDSISAIATGDHPRYVSSAQWYPIDMVNYLIINSLNSSSNQSYLSLFLSHIHVHTLI